METRAPQALSPLFGVPAKPTKFTQPEWKMTADRTFRCSHQQQILAESILKESERIISVSAEKAETNKRETEYLMKEKQELIEFARGELEKQRKVLFCDIDALKLYIERIHVTQKQMQGNKEIVQKCCILRELRIGIDLVQDEVDEQLKKELDIIIGAEQILQRTLEQAGEQLRRLQSTIYFIDRDLNCKTEALSIDTWNLLLKQNSLNLSMYHGFVPMDPSNITIEEYETYVNINLENALKEINGCREIINFIDIIMKQMIDDLTNQCRIVNDAFRQRIEQTKNIKSNLERHHAGIYRQSNEVSLNITKLEKAIAEKENYMALAHTRLGIRAQQKAMELTKDSAGVSLYNEIDSLRLDLNDLQNALIETLASQRYLLKTQVQLEEDINVKMNTLKIDELDCMTLRQSLDYHVF